MTVEDKLIKLNNHMHGFARYICKGNRDEAEECVEHAIIGGLKNKSQYKSLTFDEFKKVMNAAIYNHFLDMKRLKYKRQEAQKNCRLQDVTWAHYIKGKERADSVTIINEILAAIESLSPKYKQVIKMTIEGYKQEEIAEKMSVTRSAVATNTIRARDTLKKRLYL